jgi:RNA polymerase sigma-70 factor, ECF subfamily
MKTADSPVSAEFARLFAEQRASVRNQLGRIVPASEVDDLLQDVFVKAARGLPEFRREAGVKTWLHRITQRTALDHLRSRRHHEQQRTIGLACESNHEPCGPDRSCADAAPPAAGPVRVIQAEMHGCIRELIKRLAAEHAEVLTLKDLDGLTNAEISTRLGISLDAAKIRLHRARAAMRALLEDDCEMYRTPENTLACDRKGSVPGSERYCDHPSPRAAVSLVAVIPSKGVKDLCSASAAAVHSPK